MNRRRLQFQWEAPQQRRPRRALILVVVLVMVVLLSLLAATYTFMVRAHLSTALVQNSRFQARMAAEAGIQHAVVVLRDNPGDVGLWFDNPEEFSHALVLSVGREEGSSTFQQRSDVRTYDPSAPAAWRYNLYGPNHDEPEKVRYGFTDECARLDLNRASEAQLRRLFESVIPDDGDAEVDVDVLVDSLLDWKSTGNRPRPNGAKDEYYQTLEPPYTSKKGPFSTVEELLLVRGFTAWVVYGEDYNQNGLLDPNEDDGDEAFPPDDADGNLFRGVASYLTIWSQEMDTTSENSPRVNLNMSDVEELEERLQEADIDGDLISYITRVRSAGIVFNSVMNLLPAPPPPETDEETAGLLGTGAAAQSGEGDATSQPSGENDGAGQGDLTDQDGASGGSENQGSGRPPVFQDLTEEEPPGSVEDLPLLLDRLTVSRSPFFQGRINVSTAPREVLALVDGLAERDAEAIVSARRELRNEDMNSPAWLLTQGVLDEATFRRILDRITTKSSVYRIESVGYADHLGVVERLMMVIQMRGPIPQVLYYRNLNNLGTAYTPHGEERRELGSRTSSS